MNKVFKKNDVIEALDTASGVWRPAVAQLVSVLTITVLFPGFAVSKRTVTEHVHESLKTCPSSWPVRHLAKKTNATLEAGRPRRGATAKLPTEKASNLIIGDDVSSDFFKNQI
jgi:hypothetical protein